MNDVLNADMRFEELCEEWQKAFLRHPEPKLVRMTALDASKPFYLYKWTSRPFVFKGSVTPWWFPWEPMDLGNGRLAPGFKELRLRYRNREGGVGRPRDMARVRGAVSMEFNDMESITKARIVSDKVVWGFLGRVASQPVSQKALPERLVWIGGDYQLCIPNLTPAWIQKV